MGGEGRGNVSVAKVSATDSKGFPFAPPQDMESIECRRPKDQDNSSQAQRKIPKLIRVVDVLLESVINYEREKISSFVLA